MRCSTLTREMEQVRMINSLMNVLFSYTLPFRENLKKTKRGKQIVHL